MNLIELIKKFESSFPAHLGYGQLLSQKDLDQGDTLQREGTLGALIMIIYDLNLAIRISGMYPDRKPFESLKESPGIWRRSPNPEYWGYKSNNCSRDQLDIWKTCLMVMGDQQSKTDLKQTLWQQIKRFGLHQNVHPGTDAPENAKQFPDLPIPTEVSTYARGLMGRWSYLVTMVFDLAFLIDVALLRRNSWDQHNMCATKLLAANAKHPTIWSKLAMMLFLKTNFMERLWNYHKDSDGNNGCEPLYWLFRIAFLKYYRYVPTESP